MTIYPACQILFVGASFSLLSPAWSQPAQEPASSTALSGFPPVVELPGAQAEDQASMKAYVEVIGGTPARVAMTPIPGGRFLFGSPSDEAERKANEGPQVEVQVSPFWMGTHELGWQAYSAYQQSQDITQRERGQGEALAQDAWADAVSRPTPPYVPMDFGWGKEGKPAICMTQFAAKQFTKWLSMKTGRFYRLPTEAEWEYACRAGTTGAYSFDTQKSTLDEHAWWFDNADDQYQGFGQKKANPWGLFDMHGNVAEWCLDAYDPAFYASLKPGAKDPLNWPTELYPRVVRGGSWDDDPPALRSAARRPSRASWKVQDPQLPKSIWYHTDARFLGFRIVRPLSPPAPEERARYWEADLERIRTIQERQLRGER